jgi:hypothetical protein
VENLRIEKEISLVDFAAVGSTLRQIDATVGLNRKAGDRWRNAYREGRVQRGVFFGSISGSAAKDPRCPLMAQSRHA